MRYHDEWLKLEAEDELDEFYHRHPESEYLFYRAVANGNVEAVRENCENGNSWSWMGWESCQKIPSQI